MNKQEFISKLKQERCYHHWRYYISKYAKGCDTLVRFKFISTHLNSNYIGDYKMLLGSIFTWACTPQGDEFWRTFYTKLFYGDKQK